MTEAKKGELIDFVKVCAECGLHYPDNPNNQTCTRCKVRLILVPHYRVKGGEKA